MQRVADYGRFPPKGVHKMPNQRAQPKQDMPTAGRDFQPLPSGGSPNMGQSPNTASETTLMEQAKSTAGDAYHAVADKAVATFEDKKVGLSGGLTSMADTFRQAGESLNNTQEQNYLTEYSARYVSTAAEKLERTARYFENNDLKAMARDVESFARRNPAVFLGGAFALGMLAARFLKSSPTAGRSSESSFIPVDHQLEPAGFDDRRETPAEGRGL